jgi:hypothetical protein
LPKPRHPIFRAVWWGANLLLAIAFIAVLSSGLREFSLRYYLDGFSDAIAPGVLTAEPKVQALLDWMRAEPSRAVRSDPGALSGRDPHVNLNYPQLLRMCGTATNAFLNLAREDDLVVRRLLLLGPDGNTRHVVAEVLLDGRWIVVDPTYHVLMRDARGRLLTRRELQDPAIFEQAVGSVPDYPLRYNYEHTAHVRLERVPLLAMLRLRKVLDTVYPGWEEAADWSLLLERQSFSYLALASTATVFLLFLRFLLGRYADSRLRIPRFHLRDSVLRARVAFFSTPEIKE